MWHVLNRWRVEWPRKFSFLLLLCIFAFVFYFIFFKESVYAKFQYTSKRIYNNPFDNVQSSDYLVYNKKCHMLSMNPNDPSISQFSKKEKFETCSPEPRLSSIFRKSNGSIYLIIDKNAAKLYTNLSCCWSHIARPEDEEIDSTISVGSCQNFKQQVLLSQSIQVVYVNCTARVKTKNKLKSVSKVKKIYENVHAIVNPELVNHQIKNTAPSLTKNSTKTVHQKALSVLVLGLDSVSRLNFYRTMPLTRTYFEKRSWIELRAYNKMGDNTFPNIMAILTGHNQSSAYAKCKPRILHGLDNCSMIWYNFRDAGYATAYAEDHAQISTFNYLKAGFIKPPTDYYFRPYVLATEKLLKSRKHFSLNYCTGPELSADRIFNVAIDFSKAFANNPYFGFFWTNTISHDYINGPSQYDSKFLTKLQDMEEHGVLDDAMVVVLSDHGMRFGDGRDTFIGWYEERLPFVYIWLPEWFRKLKPDIYNALLVNQDRLTSPYDLYETLRDILQSAGGQAPPSSGCPLCSSLFKRVLIERGCKHAGISPHWCTCNDFEIYNTTDPVAVAGAQQFVNYMNSVIEEYKDKNGKMLCSKLFLKRIIQVKKLIDLDEDPYEKVLKFFYQVEVVPGGGKFETTISYHEPNKYTIREDDVSIINLYGHSARCLERGIKKYCQCKT